MTSSTYLFLSQLGLTIISESPDSVTLGCPEEGPFWTGTPADLNRAAELVPAGQSVAERYQSFCDALPASR